MKSGDVKKQGRKARGINEVVGFLLILAVVIMTISIYMIYFMPTLGWDQEITQMSEVKERFAEFKLNIDSLWMTRQGTSSFGPSLSLGSGETTGLLSFFPFLRPPRAGAVLALNQRDENITITSDSYILGGGGSKVSQAVGTSPVLLSVNTTPSNLYIKLYATDLLKERGVFVHGPTWDAWVNVTPNYIYTDPTSWTLNGTDITVTTLVGGRAVATSLPVYRSISSSTTYKVDLMNPVYGISPQFQNPQNLWLSASDGSGILASYEMQNSYTPMVSASTFPLGSIEFRSNNLYYTPQTHYYQLGGVFLEQDEGSTTEIPPDISVSLSNGAPVVNVGEILLQGNAVTANMSGSGPITVTSQVTGIVNAPLMPGKNTRWVNLRIQAASPNAADMWNRTFHEIAARGGLPAGSYAAGSSGTIAYLNITGDPQLYTIQLSLTRVNIATDYILEYSPGGIARGWREGPGFPGQPGTDLTGCGDGTCNGAETCTTCPGDCGICPTCGDGTCNIGETCSSCPGDCGACPPSCGDLLCNGAETCSSCPGDCGACPTCGDLICNGAETCSSCPGDCGACGGGGGGGGGAGPLVINPCDWVSRKKLTINGTMVSGTQTNFPVIVSLPFDSDLAASAQASGNDIVFTDSGGSTVLPHEIENFTKSSGALTAWVKLPTLSASVNTDIYLYYGNSSVGSQQNATQVWSNGYAGVWHLGELVTDNAVASGVHKDSTSYGNNGNQYNNSRVTGKVGDAQNFEGDVRDEFIEIPNSASTENLQEGDYSLEAWFNSDVTPPGTLDSDWNAYYGIVIKPGWHIGLRFDRWAKFDSDHYLTGGTEVWVGGVSGKSSSRWYHVVSVLNRTGGSHRIYVDGVEEDYATFTAGTAANEFNQVPWRLGIASTNNRGGNWEWPANGKIDEVRLSGIARSAQWIATEYANQNRPDLFISRGSGESPCGGGGGSSLVINPCDWASRKKLTINMSMVSGTQASFPVLVNLSSDADLANGTTGAQSSGNDIVFTDSGGTAVIPHEIENFTKSSGALLSWVKVPSISSGANTDIYMYFGNSTKPSQRNVTGVWDTNYLAVYHLNQDPSGTVIDSTGHANLSSEGTMGAANLVNAKIGKGIQPTDYSSTIDHLTSTNTVTVHSFTMEGWGDASNWYNWMSFVDVNTHAAGAYYRDHTSNPDADLYVDMANGITDNRQLSGVMATGLHHTVSRYNSSSQVLDAFVDGSTTGFSYSALVKPSLTGYVGVGAWSYYDTQLNWGDPFRGTLDEVRISNIARSDGWIQTGYNNQYRPHLFVSAGTREAPCGGGGSCSGVTVDTTSSGWAQAASGLTISHTASGSNRLMLVGVSIQDSDTVPTDTTDSVKVSSITYNGTVLTKVGSKYNADDAMVEIWKLIAPDTGTHNVVITLNRTLASQGFVIAGVTTFAGVDQTTPLGTFASQAGDDDNQINVTVSSATGEIAFGVIANEYNSIITDAGQTERWNIHKVGSLDTTNGAGSTKTGASSVLLKWTLSSTYNHWATAGISVKPCTVPTYTVNLQVGSMLDDCFRYFTNKLDCSTYHDDYVDTTSKDTTATTSTGLRFTSVAIPKNAAITKAYLTLRAASTSGSPGGGVIQGEASDNGAAFTEGAWSEFDGRTRTTNSVPWSPSAWSVGTDYTSPELKTVIQEIVNRAGWGSGNSMVLFI